MPRKSKGEKKSGKIPNSAAKTELGIPKWQLVENVVAICQELAANIPGAKVIQKAQVPIHDEPAFTRDVDVLVKIPFGDTAVFIGVEVKARKDVLDAPDMDALIGLRQDVQLHHYVVVSLSGYTPLAELKARKAGIELTTIDEFRQSRLFTPKTGSLFTVRTPSFPTLNLMYESEDDFQRVAEVMAKVGAKSDALTLEAEGSRKTLVQFASDCANSWAAENEARVRPAELYQLAFLVSPLEWKRACLGGHELPLPHAVEAVFSFSWQEMPDYRFRLKGVEVATSFTEINGARHQVYLIGEPSGEDLWKPYLAISPLNPPKTSVSIK